MRQNGHCDGIAIVKNFSYSTMWWDWRFFPLQLTSNIFTNRSRTHLTNNLAEYHFKFCTAKCAKEEKKTTNTIKCNVLMLKCVLVAFVFCFVFVFVCGLARCLVEWFCAAVSMHALSSHASFAPTVYRFEATININTKLLLISLYLCALRGKADENSLMRLMMLFYVNINVVVNSVNFPELRDCFVQTKWGKRSL